MLNGLLYLYHTFISYPILNILVFFYNTIAFRDLGLSIIFVTLLVRLILYPFFHKSAKQQILMQRIQPQVKKLQEQHKDDRAKQGQALMDLYKEHGVNPFSGILLLVIQIPILIALYRLFLSGFGPGSFTGLYSFIHLPGTINQTFLGFIDLSKKNFILVVCSGIAQYVQARLAIYRAPDATGPLSAPEKMARQMSFIGPIFTIIIFFNLPAAVGLYWLVSSAFSALQQYIVNRHLRTKYGV